MEVITPLFLSGAKQQEVELRPTSIRGMLRYWYRALLGGIGITDIKKLKELESKLWGKEDRGSAVGIKVKNFKFAGDGPKEILELGLGSRNPGLTYLLFSAKMNKRPYADVGSTFCIELFSHKNEADTFLSLATSAFWCWVYLGGLGTRSRRGGGDLRVIDQKLSDSIEAPDFSGNFLNVQAFRDYLISGLNNCLDIVATKNSLKITSASASNFANLSKNCLTMWIANKTWEDWRTVMEDVGKEFMNFRKQKPPDYNAVKKFLTKGTLPNSIERAAFGLPIIFRYTSLGRASATVSGDKVERRSSPLIFHFVKLMERKYSVVIIKFSDRFLPSPSRLQIEKRGLKHLIQQPSQTIITDLIETFKHKLNLLNII